MEKISERQYMFLISGVMLEYILVLSFMDTTARQDSWIISIVAFFTCIPFILSYVSILKWFPGKNLMEIFVIVFGNLLGKVFCVLYMLFFLLLFGFNLRDFADFYVSYFVPETPHIVLMIIFVIVAAYAVKKGFNSIAKINIFSFAFAVFSIVLTFTLLIGKMDFLNFLPVFELPKTRFIQALSNYMLVPNTEIFILMMAGDKIKTSKNLAKLTFIGMAIGTVIFLIIIIRNTAVLGPISSIVDSASFESVRLIWVGDFLSRVELLTSFGYILVLFTGICIIYYALLKSASEVFNIKPYDPLIFPLGCLGIFFALTCFKSTTSHAEFAVRYNVVVFSWIHFVIPPLTLLVAKIRKKKMNWVQEE